MILQAEVDADKEDKNIENNFTRFFNYAHHIKLILRKRVQIQGIIQKYIDHSISSTINLPEDVQPELISDIYIKSMEK